MYSKYIVKFNNHIGNVGANSLKDAMLAAVNIVSYKLADVAHILLNIPNQKLKTVELVTYLNIRQKAQKLKSLKEIQ